VVSFTLFHPRERVADILDRKLCWPQGRSAYGDEGKHLFICWELNPSSPSYWQSLADNGLGLSADCYFRVTVAGSNPAQGMDVDDL
jgi:hypothetical protein